MAVCGMILFVFFVLEVSHIHAGITSTHKTIYHEDIGQLSHVWQYLNYEEPEFKELEGMTTDYFTDQYVGYYTKLNQPKPFIWDFVGEGEIPWAGAIIGHENDIYAHKHPLETGCGATLLTGSVLMTPCGCVRSMIYSLRKEQDPWRLYIPSKKYFRDQGTYISVVMNTADYDMWTIFPRINKNVGVDLCMKSVGEKSPKSFNAYDSRRNRYFTERGYYNSFMPALMGFEPGIDRGIGVPWPPQLFSYVTEDGKRVIHENSTQYRLVSFGFRSLDVDVKMYDNFGKEVELYTRLIKVRQILVQQADCSENYYYKKLEPKKWLPEYPNSQNAAICWYNNPEPRSEGLYQNWKDASVPHYIKSVWNGLPGSPIEHRGQFIGWQIDVLSQKREFTMSRGVDAFLINYVNSKVPELAKGNRPSLHDRNRPQFAIHDQKLFLPDFDLKKEDVDVLEWSLVGKSRFHGFAGAESISPERAFVFGVSLVQLFNVIV